MDTQEQSTDNTTDSSQQSTINNSENKEEDTEQTAKQETQEIGNGIEEEIKKDQEEVETLRQAQGLKEMEQKISPEIERPAEEFTEEPINEKTSEEDIPLTPFDKGESEKDKSPTLFPSCPPCPSCPESKTEIREVIKEVPIIQVIKEVPMIKEVVKEVIKEVPVEKIITKEVPKEVIKEVIKEVKVEVCSEEEVEKRLKQKARDISGLGVRARQAKREENLERILQLVQKKKKITNDDVQKLLRVADTTATNYLTVLIKRGQIKVFGRRAGSFYELGH
jgi:exonuclease VII large subunit